MADLQCLVETLAVKAKIRALVEEQEQINYDKRMKKDWVDAVTPMVSKYTAWLALAPALPNSAAAWSCSAGQDHDY